MKINIDGWFKRLVMINLIMVFIVIIAGSVVRVTDSGMGCPDWPKCFGAYIPPTNESQVTWQTDHSYFEGQMIIYQEKLFVAQQDFVSGRQFAPQHWEEYTKHSYAVYNPVHTWIEFINRLLTGIMGVPLMLMLVLSFFYWKDRRARTLLSITAVLMVAYEAWLGKLVVDSELQGQTVTEHLAGVFVLIAVLLILWDKCSREHGETARPSKLFANLTFVSVGLTLLMVGIGTQVREQIDMIAQTSDDRSSWINEVNWMFILHRSMIWAIVLLNGYLLVQALQKGWYKSRLIVICGLIFLEAIIGVILTYFGLPKAAQPLHLLLSALLFAVQFDLLIKLRAPKAIAYYDEDNSTLESTFIKE